MWKENGQCWNMIWSPGSLGLYFWRPSLLLHNRLHAAWCPNVFRDSVFLLDAEMMHVSAVLRPCRPLRGAPHVLFSLLSCPFPPQVLLRSYRLTYRSSTHPCVHTALCTWGRAALAQTWRANKISGSVCVCVCRSDWSCHLFVWALLGKSLIVSMLKFLHF